LDELLEDVVEQFKSQAEMKKIHFEFHIGAGIFVAGDSNLLENVFKYTAAGGRIALML
jgi:signal transduction histidine kinase